MATYNQLKDDEILELMSHDEFVNEILLDIWEEQLSELDTTIYPSMTDEEFKKEYDELFEFANKHNFTKLK